MKPKNIILVRHGQSEGNVDKSIHWNNPDWKINLTDLGCDQALRAGERISDIVNGGSVGAYISPYQRTMTTAQLALSSLDIKGLVKFKKQDPRLREQEYGNGMTSSEAYKIEKERIAYGTFFYRIKDGESGADVYDRCSGFMETLHRDFKKEDFPENVVIVTHGFTLRVFLMRWFHNTVKEFETWKNPYNCEVFHMKLDIDTDKYSLQTPLRIRT